MKSTEEVGLVFGTHPLDDDDMTPDIVCTVLRRTPGVVDADRAAREITALIREYQLYRLDEMRY